MTELEALAARATALSSKVDFWNSASLWALAITAAAGAATFACQRFIIIRSKELSDAQEQIAHIKEASVKLELGNQQLELGKQQERAAKAELNLLNLKNTLKDRTISDEQKDRLIKLLTGGPNGPIAIIWTSTDTDGFSLAERIKEILTSSGWANVSVGQAMGTDAVGIGIAVHNLETAPAYAAFLRKSFADVGFPLEAFEDPKYPPELVRILIGHKPKLSPECSPSHTPPA